MVYNNAKYKNILIINLGAYNFAKSRFNEVVCMYLIKTSNYNILSKFLLNNNIFILLHRRLNIHRVPVKLIWFS